MGEMQEKSDAQLLCEFVRQGSQAAFRAIVERHTDFVYSAALRQVESSAAAADIAQGVFTDLARKAVSLTRGHAALPPSLAGWLHRATRYAALNHLRDARRRLSNERQAMQQLLTNSESSAVWEQIRPVLDEALDSLGDEDREALLLCYFKNRDFRSVGSALGVSDDAAQKRVSRAVERLREFFSKRNVTIGASGLVALISANAVQSAPIGLALAISSAALAGTVATATTAIALTKTMFMTTLQKAMVTIAVTALAGAGVYEAHQAARLREQNQTLQRQQATEIRQLQQERDDARNRLASLSRPATPRLPAPSIRMAPQMNASPAEDLQMTNLYGRYLDKQPMLTDEQAEAFLKTNHENASSLLAIYRINHDEAMLKEAMETYPNDARVAIAAVFDKELTPQEQLQWLGAFEKAAPDNALANYLSAYNDFSSGQIDQGLQEMAASAGKGINDYTSDQAQELEEAYLSAGYSEAEAERIADSNVVLPELYQVKQLGVDLVDLGNAYNQAGDAASAQAAFQMALTIGQQYANPSTDWTLISQLMGMAVEKTALSAMNPNSPDGNNGQTVQDVINQIDQNRAAIRQVTQQANALLPGLSDQDVLNYENRRREFGEQAALAWVANTFGQQ